MTRFLRENPDQTLEGIIKNGDSIVGLVGLLRKGTVSLFKATYQYGTFVYTLFSECETWLKLVITGTTSIVTFVFYKQIAAGIIQCVVWGKVPVVVSATLIAKATYIFIPIAPVAYHTVGIFIALVKSGIRILSFLVPKQYRR